MLPAEQLELITAAVDGELSATEARAFRRLIAASPEARALYAKLKADSARVRALPQATPPADLHNKILSRLASSTPAPAKPLPQPTRRRLPTWAPAALAASVLLCVTAGSFAFFNSQSKPNSIVKNPWANALPAAQDTPSVPSPTATALHGQPDPSAIVHMDVSPVPPSPHPRPVPPETIAVAPEPRPRHDFIGAGPLPPIPPLDYVRVRVPFLRPVADLDREDTRQELTDELTRDPNSPARFDLFVRDTARGVDVFQNAARAAGLTLFADAATLEKLKKKQIASVVIYTESLTAAELTALFEKVCAEDTNFSPRVCDALHVATVVRSDELELKAILGIDVGLFKRPLGAGGSAPVGDRDKPVSAGTLDSVSKSLTSPGAKPGEPFAVLMTWQSAPATLGRTPPATSAELKQYLAKRGTRKPNAVPAVIVIRLVG